MKFDEAVDRINKAGSDIYLSVHGKPPCMAWVYHERWKGSLESDGH